MKAKNYLQVLKARGFKVREHTDYRGTNVFVKEHKFNKVVCTIEKDTHGKAQTMTFNIFNAMRLPSNIDEFKEAEFDRQYLTKEALAIHDAFEQLKTMKAPKHLYCF